MLRLWVFYGALIICSNAVAEHPVVSMVTSEGEVRIRLFTDKSPETTANFLRYVAAGEYDGTIFHRVVAGFMIQGGGYYEDLSEAPEKQLIINEADNGLQNLRGTVAMARLDGIDSAGRQFFINTSDNTHLDHTSTSCTRADETAIESAAQRGLRKPRTCTTFGYAVFGEVLAGMETVDAIEVVPTEDREDSFDVPVTTVVIERMRIQNPAAR